MGAWPGPASSVLLVVYAAVCPLPSPVALTFATQSSATIEQVRLQAALCSLLHSRRI